MEAFTFDAAVVGVPTAAPDVAEASFSQLIADSHRRLEHLAYMLCGDRATAEDAVAEAYAKVWPRYRRGRVREPYAYLRRAVVNQVTGSHRKAAIEQREVQRWTGDMNAPATESTIDDSEMLKPALLALPAKQRAVIVLRFLEDLSEQETAAVLGVKPGTVKSRSARGLEQLRRLLEEPDRG
jgi:RNA polymerase sigma-70 factor (sigma-E family)